MAKVLVKLVVWGITAAVNSFYESFGYSKLAPLWSQGSSFI